MQRPIDVVRHGRWAGQADDRAWVDMDVSSGMKENLSLIYDALEVPETGTTVRITEGKRRVQDGPYADTKEQLAGILILELPSIHAPLDWAARCPAAAAAARLRSGHSRRTPSSNLARSSGSEAEHSFPRQDND